MHIPNYTMHLIEDLKVVAQNLSEEAPHETVKIVNLMRDMHDAVKFIAPLDGRFINDSLSQEDANETMEAFAKYLKMFRLPYRRMVVEYQSQATLKGKPTGGFIRTVLYAEEHTKPDGQQGASVIAGYRLPNANGWAISPVSLFIPYESEYKLLTDVEGKTPAEYLSEMVGSGDSVLGQRLIGELVSGRGKARRALETEVTLWLPTYSGRTKVVQEHGQKPYTWMMAQHLWGESLSLLELCAVLNCSNIDTDTVHPPAKLNAKRERNGKLPYFEYKVLMVRDPAQGVTRAGFTVTDRRHPRQHLRRGHIRRYQTGKSVWINQMVVGSARDGIIQKDYAVTRHLQDQ